MFDMKIGFVVTLRFFLWNLVWSKDNSDRLLTVRQEAIDASEKAGKDIDVLMGRTCAKLRKEERPRNLDEFFTPKYLLNADIDWSFFINIDLCLKEIKRSSKLLEFFRSCSEKDFEDWFSKREPITDEVSQKRCNRAAIRHEKRLNLAIAENKKAVKKEKERKESERRAFINELEKTKRRRLENQRFLNRMGTPFSWSAASGPTSGFNARRHPED